MAPSVEERIERLKAEVQPVAPEDLMAEAGRKVLLVQFINMLQHEAGSRLGEDVEEVHDMRVAIRRMRSAVRLLGAYYKRAVVRAYSDELRNLAWVLGQVRDLDVLIGDIQEFQATLEAEQQAALQEAIDELERQRTDAREDLIEVLDSRRYRKFVKSFSGFVTTPEAGARPAAEGIVPTQVRHVLPGMIYNHLAAVRAYDTVLPDVPTPTFHSLRIEFKRLRYTVSLFEELLGSQIGDFIDEIKALQDCLGHMNDAATARTHLNGLLADHPIEALSLYLTRLEEKDAEMRTEFLDLWSRFNSRKVQEKLSRAVLALH
jgi:CHAD domain-containing protein